MGHGKSTTQNSETLEQPAAQSQKTSRGEWFTPFAFFYLVSARNLLS